MPPKQAPNSASLCQNAPIVCFVQDGVSSHERFPCNPARSFIPPGSGRRAGGDFGLYNDRRSRRDGRDRHRIRQQLPGRIRKFSGQRDHRRIEELQAFEIPRLRASPVEAERQPGRHAKSITPIETEIVEPLELDFSVDLGEARELAEQVIGLIVSGRNWRTASKTPPNHSLIINFFHRLINHLHNSAPSIPCAGLLLFNRVNSLRATREPRPFLQRADTVIESAVRSVGRWMRTAISPDGPGARSTVLPSPLCSYSPQTPRQSLRLSVSASNPNRPQPTESTPLPRNWVRSVKMPFSPHGRMEARSNSALNSQPIRAMMARTYIHTNSAMPAPTEPYITL
jgi:hypothetical protein